MDAAKIQELNNRIEEIKSRDTVSWGSVTELLTDIAKELPEIPIADVQYSFDNLVDKLVEPKE